MSHSSPSIPSRELSHSSPLRRTRSRRCQPRLPPFSYRANLVAALRGFRRLVECIEPVGLQSWVAPSATFPAASTVAMPDLLAAPLPPAARRKFAAFGDRQAETFTSFLALKLFGPILGQTAAPIVDWARVHHLERVRRYHFFASPGAIAADTDCTGVALVGLHRVGALAAHHLHQGAEQIMQSAALESLSASENRTHGKDNGELVEGVFKVYWDDEVQAGTRGRKHDPSCVANALHAVFLAAKRVGFSLRGPMVASERRDHGGLYSRCIDRAFVIERNIDYLLCCLDQQGFALGTRYYPSPDAFLCFASALVRDFPERVACLRAPLLGALGMRWYAPATSAEDPANPASPINLAMRIIAAQNLGVRPAAIFREKARLLQMQLPSGGWPAAALFKLGSLSYYFGSESMSTVFALRALLGPFATSDPAAIRP